MKINRSILTTILLILMAIAVVYQYRSLNSAKAKLLSHTKSMSIPDDAIETIIKKVPIRAILKAKPEISAIIKDSLSARPKQVETIYSTRIKYINKYNNVVVKDTVILIDTIRADWKYISVSDSCISALVIMSDTSSFLEIKADIPVTVITRWERSKSALWGLIKYGKKIRTTSYWTVCPGIKFSEKESLRAE